MMRWVFSVQLPLQRRMAPVVMTPESLKSVDWSVWLSMVPMPVATFPIRGGHGTYVHPFTPARDWSLWGSTAVETV